MYIINLKGKRFGKKVFDTYEGARSYVRKYIRKKYINAVWFYTRNNPAISDFNFSVVKK